MAQSKLSVARPTETRNGFTLTGAPEDNARKVVKIFPINFDYPVTVPDGEKELKLWDKAYSAWLRMQLTLAGVDLKGFSFERKAGCSCGCSPGFVGLTPIVVAGETFKTVWITPEGKD